MYFLEKIAQGNIWVFTEFSTREGEQAFVEMRHLRLSAEGARKNSHESDISDNLMECVSVPAGGMRFLGVQVEERKKDKTIFYTSYTYTMIKILALSRMWIYAYP